MLRSAGQPVATFPVTAPPVITSVGKVAGTHTYCYVVSSADPLDGITAPSPQACIGNEPQQLTLATTFNSLQTTDVGKIQNGGPTPAFLWYVSEDGGPYQLVTVATQFSAAEDVGQRPSSRGGWLVTLPVGNPDISKHEDFFSTIQSRSGNTMTLIDPIPTAVTEGALSHDDTDAVQSAINAAESAGGGIVSLAEGTFNIQRPAFHASGGAHTRVMNYFWWSGIGFLYIADNAPGNVVLRGQGVGTVLRTPPDHGGSMFLLDAGQPVPPFYPDAPIPIQDVQKGSITVQLAPGASTTSPQTGDDIELFSGTIGSKGCQATTGEPGNCHYSELNTVLSRNGNTLTLVYPTSKRYYADDQGSLFGITVRTHLPKLVVPHRIAFEHMTIDTYDPLLSTGNVIGMLVSDVHITGSISHGLLAGGTKRDVTIENSSWGIGAGDATWNGTDELDKCVNFLFRGNAITGYAAATAEGLSMGARIFGTEGASRFAYQDNSFTGVLLLFQQTTDDAIVHNTFVNSSVNMNSAYGDVNYYSGSYQNVSYLSFGSQENALVDSNTFSGDTLYTPPTLIWMGHYTNAAVTNNQVSYSGFWNIPAIISYGGMLTGNTVAFSSNSPRATGFALVPDLTPNGPAAAIVARKNTIAAPRLLRGFYVPNPGVTVSSPVCIEETTYNVGVLTTQIAVDAPASVNMSCASVDNQ